MTTRNYTQPWPLSCWMLGTGAPGPKEAGTQWHPKNTLVKSSSSGKLKLGYCKFAIPESV